MAKRYFIYGISSCPFCVRAVERLESEEFSYCFFDLEQDEDFLKEVKVFYDHATVPIVLENDSESGETSFIGGCDSLLERLDHE